MTLSPRKVHHHSFSKVEAQERCVVPIRASLRAYKNNTVDSHRKPIRETLNFSFEMSSGDIAEKHPRLISASKMDHNLFSSRGRNGVTQFKIGPQNFELVSSKQSILQKNEMGTNPAMGQKEQTIPLFVQLACYQHLISAECQKTTFGRFWANSILSYSWTGIAYYILLL